jgi:hypothetical protein
MRLWVSNLIAAIAIAAWFVSILALVQVVESQSPASTLSGISFGLNTMTAILLVLLVGSLRAGQKSTSPESNDVVTRVA